MAQEKETKEPGRPTVVTSEVLGKLEQAFMWGCSNREACLYADISESTLYDYKAANPAFSEKIEKLKDNPKLKARMIVNKKLDDYDGETAKWYLERKARNEFSTKQETDNFNKNFNIDPNTLDKEKITELSRLLDELI